ncbi:MAG: DnaJ domain-containing protein [Clostridia bacterium]|nr:J domain-containing protein [Clostridium sp.]
MNKNYYDILQVNQNASPEIIEKAYKTLAKKYHPDLQPEENKKQAEEILKDINEAYEILSNPISKVDYDNSLKENYISEEDYKNLYNQNEILKNKLNNIYQKEKNINNINSENINYPKNNINDNLKKQEEFFAKQQAENLKYQEELQRAREKAYHDAYIQDLKNRGYKIKYKKTFKDYLKGFITIFIVIIVLIALWHIPFIHNFFMNLYNENELLHYIVDLFLNIFN